MIPRRPLVGLAGLLTLLGFGSAMVPQGTASWIAAALVALLLVSIDGIAVARTRPPEVERRTPGSLSLANWSEIHLVIRNTASMRHMRLRVYDHHPEVVIARDLPQELVIPGNNFAEISYGVRPTRRGPLAFPACELRICSPLGFWWRRRLLPVESQLRCYPNYSTISKLLAYEVDNRLHVAGVRRSRRRGEGIEFHQLRDYRDGDSLRAIDWKATARMSRLISREYQDERDQNVVFMLDAGRRMLAKDAELSHFDLALNAMLLLSYVALRQGDSVGVMTVGDQRSWLPPRKGVDAIKSILNHVYDVQPRAVEIDYVAAATDLAVRQRRRSLVVMLTNVREEASDDLQAATRLLQRRHLVILASLREQVLDETLDKTVNGFNDALLYAATARYMDSRRDSQKLLRARGVYVEDCLSGDLPSAITNRYLAVKQAGLL